MSDITSGADTIKGSECTERTVTIVNDGFQLEGTLCTPKGYNPGIFLLLIAGSGPVDRNENGKRFDLNIFNAIAAQLVERGISTLRYDKRGCGASEGVYVDVGHSDLVSDATAWFDFLKSEVGEDGGKIFVLGHSEGTLICPQIAKVRGGVAGQVLIAPMYEKLASTVERQTRQLLEEIKTMPGLKGRFTRLCLYLASDQVKKQRKLFERVRNTDRSSFRRLFTRVNAKWLRELDAINPVAVHEGVSVPTLVIAAAKDLQCRPQDGERLQESSPATVELITVPDLTHILKVDFEKPSLLRYPELVKQPTDPRVGDAIASWLLDQPADSFRFGPRSRAAAAGSDTP